MKKFFAFVAAALTALTMNAANLTVAQAIEEGMKLDSAATGTDTVVVEGYVIKPSAFSILYMNQSWYMADSATATSSDFQAYNCFPIDGNDTTKVLAGDKVLLTGRLKKFWNKSASKYVIEIEKSNATFVSKVEGDRTIDKGSEEITVAKALEIGEALADNGVSAKQYTITGYISAINVKSSDAWSDEYKNQSFWVSDTKGDTAKTNANGAFYVYRGKPETGAGLVEGTKVKFTTTIKKYVGSSGAVIENNDQNISIKVLEVPEIKYDTITVAQAVEIALALDNNKETTKAYVVVGSVKKIKAYSTQYNNQDFYIIDDLSNKEVDDLNCYHTKIAAPGCAEGDRIIIVGKLKNSFNDKNSTNNAQITGGEAEILWKAGIEEVTLTEKAQKVMVDGVVYVIRNNKMFDLMGNQVR